MLASSDTTFPVYIDPSFSKPGSVWTHVNKASPSTSYWSDSSSRSSMRVGRQWQANDVWRTFVRFDTGLLAGSAVTKASLFVTLDHSASCGDTPVQLWKTSNISTTTAVTWNSSAGYWSQLLQTVNAGANESSCPKPDKVVEFGASPVLSSVQEIARTKVTSSTFGLRAPNPDLSSGC